MTTIKEEINIRVLVQDYLKHLYNDCPESLIVAKGDVAMTVADWCHRFGGTPKGETNFEFLDSQFKRWDELNGSETGRGRVDDDG